MKILYICGNDPRLTSSGSQQRTNFIWQALDRIGTVTVCYPPARANEFILRLTKLLRHPFRSEKEVRRYLGIGNEQFDAVVVRYMVRCSEFAAWKLGPLYIDIDDVPLQAFDSIEKYRLPAILRGIGRLLLCCIMRYILKRSAGAWVVKHDDSRFLPPNVKSAVLRNLATPPSQNYVRSGLQEQIIMTVGLMGYEPNYQGVMWFLNNIWPTVHSRYPTYHYVIAGRDAPTSMVEVWKTFPNVRVLGFVDDLEALYARSSMVVAPILTGAGTCVKVLESCLRGRKTFVTKCARRGYGGVECDGLMLQEFQNAQEFVSGMCEWLEQDDATRESLQKQIAENAACMNSLENMEAILREVMGMASERSWA